MLIARFEELYRYFKVTMKFFQTHATTRSIKRSHTGGHTVQHAGAIGPIAKGRHRMESNGTGLKDKEAPGALPMERAR